MTTGNQGLDALADAIAERVIERMIAAQTSNSERLLDVPNTARYMGTTSHAVRRMIARGELQPTRRGRRVFCDRNDLDQYIDLHKTRV